MIKNEEYISMVKHIVVENNKCKGTSQSYSSCLHCRVSVAVDMLTVLVNIMIYITYCVLCKWYSVHCTICGVQNEGCIQQFKY